MRKVLFPRLVRPLADDDLVQDLAAAAKRGQVTLSEFARRELRRAIVTRSPHGDPDDYGPGPFRPAPGLREAA